MIQGYTNTRIHGDSDTGIYGYMEIQMTGINGYMEISRSFREISIQRNIQIQGYFREIQIQTNKQIHGDFNEIPTQRNIRIQRYLGRFRYREI